MTSLGQGKPTYDIARMRDDMAAKGWIPQDLARAAEVSHMTVSRFLRGERQTPRAAKKLSRALGRGSSYYLIRSSSEAA